MTWLMSTLVGAGIEVELMLSRCSPLEPLRTIPTEQGSYLIIDPVKESRHRGKDRGFQNLHVVR